MARSAVIPCRLNGATAAAEGPNFNGTTERLIGTGAQLDPKTSPLVYVVMPTRLRGALWSAGEVGFTATSLREQFPRLHAIQKQFSSWLSQFELVFAQRSPGSSQWNYYLEGGLRNRDVDLYALPNAARDLRTGQYFVRDGISEPELDQLCGVLRLRGVAC